VTATQVRLISISNTLSRLLSGPLADLIAPLTGHIPDDVSTPPRRYRISRVTLLSGVSLLLAGAFVYLELVIRKPDDLQMLRCVALTFVVHILFNDDTQHRNWYRLRYCIHNSVRYNFCFLFPFIAHQFCLDPVLCPAFGEARTLGATLA